MVDRVHSKRRRVMRAFKIHEISSVDNPAQVHARMTIMKRADAQQEQDDMMQFEKIGGDRVASFDNLEDAIGHLMDIQKCSRLTAMEQAASTQPGLVRKYNDEGERIAKAAQDAAASRPVAKSARDFEKRVTEIMHRDRINKLDAMAKVPHEFPVEFSAYQDQEA